MEFKKIQCHKTLKILKYFVDGRAVTQREFELKEYEQLLAKRNYNSSLLRTNRITGNYIHTHSIN